MQECFVSSLIEICPVVLEAKIFKCHRCIFTISKLSPLEKGVILHLNKLEFPSPKDALCQVWLKLVKRFYSWRFLNFPFHKGVALYVNKLEFPSPQKMLCPQFRWDWLIVSGEEDFKISSMHFRYIVIISPWRRVWPFIWTNESPSLKDALCKENENVKSLEGTDRRTDGRQTTGD